MAGLALHHLRQMPKVGVGGAEDEVVLDDQGGDPEVVGGDGDTSVKRKRLVHPGSWCRRTLLGNVWE